MAIYGTSGSNTIDGSSGADEIYGYPDVATPPTTQIAGGLYRPLFATAPKGDNDHLYVVSQGGRITVYDLTDPQASPKDFIVIPESLIDGNDEAGLLGFTFHPQFATNGKCYVNYTEEGSREQVIVEYTIDLTSTSSPPAHTTRKIMTIDYPDTTSHHRAGWIDFGPDGMLYIATGDGWRNENGELNGNAAQTLVNADGSINHLGKILRINVNGDDFSEDDDRNYSIPDGTNGEESNPTEFQGVNGELPQPSEIWAIGLRNPWRAGFGPDGKLYVGDVGQDDFEEINIVEAGKNYGWRVASRADGPQAEPEGQDYYTDPYHHYGRGIGQSVTGGYFYDGAGDLDGKYIFADYVAGKIFAMDVGGGIPAVQDVTNRFKDAQGASINFGQISSFGLDGRGNLYVVSYAQGWGQENTGKIFRLSDNTPVEDVGDLINGAGGDDTIYGGGGDDTVHGGSDNDLVYGDADNDRLYGDRGEDTLRGGDGVDTLEGGDGADSLEGGAGNDVYYVDVDDAVVEAAGGGYDVVHVAGLFYELDEGQEVEEVRAVADVQVVGLVGNELSQRLVGNAGSNALDGYEGQDTLEGLGGNDTYRVDGNDTVIETEDGGTDTVRSIADYVLGAHLENLQLLENAIKATGNDLKNEITGNDKANVIDGAGGEDTLNGGDGDDTYHVYGLETIEEIAGEGIDTIIFKGGGSYTLGAGIHVEVLKVDLDSGWGNLTGNAFGNKLYSSRGNNALDGGEGDDTVVLSGNRSDYTITLNSDQSFTIEDKRTTGDGRDTVRNVEIFEFADRKVNVKNLLAPTDIILDGDAVTENTKAGELIGQFRVVDNPGDTHRFELVDDAGGRFDLQVVNGVTSLAVKDGVRLDYEQATQHSITVKVTDGAGDSITETIAIRVADSLNESATGSALGDRILGGSGRDTFSGGAGHDTIDAGAGNDRLTGDAGNDSLTGGAGNDVFSGGDGNDRLTGGLGQDTLTGSKGRDVFIFDDRETGSSKTKADYITDFKGREGDRIDLRAVDANTKKSGDQNFSFIGTKAFSKEGQVRYEKAKGYTYVYLNTDADKSAEAVIKLKGAIDLSKGWFVL